MKNNAQFNYLSRRRPILVFLMALSLITLLVSFRWDAAAEKAAEVEALAPSCRFGTSTSRTADNPYMQELGVGWMVNFWASPSSPAPAGIEYVPMVRMEEEQSGGVRLGTYRVKTPAVSSIIDNHSGALWLIGNEVDRKDDQDDMMPDVYARAYHDLYHEIKALDPDALVANSGLVNVSPGRLQYLDLVWDSYKEQFGTEMPVDVWNMHIYILAEKTYPNGGDSFAAIALGTDPALALWRGDPYPQFCGRPDFVCWGDHDSVDRFWEQVYAMRKWMKEHDQQNKPLILSEYSMLFPPDYVDENGRNFEAPRVIDYLNSTMDLLESGKGYCYWLSG
jgi:hypothetical protein